MTIDQNMLEAGACSIEDDNEIQNEPKLADAAQREVPQHESSAPVLQHGGDVTGFIDEYGVEPLDFSANISPLGLPDKVRQAIIDSLDKAEQYPDPLCRHLVKAISGYQNVDEKFIICGNGSADLIFRMAQALRPKRALVCAPTFSEYADAMQTVGCEVEQHILQAQNGYRIDQSFIDKIVPGVELVFVCQPNNPTGVITPRDMVLKVLQKCENVGARLVLDECFVGFLENRDDITLTGYLGSHPGLVIMKAFTKLYGMPGVRLGYLLCSDLDFIEMIRDIAQPWPVSQMAQAAGIAAVDCADYAEQVRLLVGYEREFVRGKLAKLGIEALGQANFLFFHLDDNGALTAKMRERGVLIRDCSNYVGLGPGYYRIAVRTREENTKMLQALEDALAK